MPINLNDTRTMLEAVVRTQEPTTTLVDTFFAPTKTFPTKYVDIETRMGGKQIAPFVVPGSKGRNLARVGTQMRSYTAPLMKPKRVITIDDISQRGFGEGVYSTKTPDQRAMELRAEDLRELINACTRRQEKMAADLLVTGKYECAGYADEGEEVVVDEVSFTQEWKNLIRESSTHWDNPDAKILDTISDLSRTIRTATGVNPTIAICSYNVFSYLLNNKQLKEYMSIPNRENATFLSIQPQIVRPELIRVGRIDMLNLEIYVYDASYLDEKGKMQKYIPEDTFILGSNNIGKRYFGAVTHIEGADGDYRTYEGMYIPKLTVKPGDDLTELAVSSRCVIAPDFLDSWGTIKCKG